MGSKNSKAKLQLPVTKEGKYDLNKVEGFALTNDLLVQKMYSDPDNDYIKEKLLGQGSFGSVYLVKNRLTKFQRAMKELRKTYNFTQENEKVILNEINVLKSLDHPGVLKIFEIYSKPEAYFLVTELCNGGDLFDDINRCCPYNEELSAFIMYQLFSAMNYCHQMKIIHRDLKPENVFIYSRDENNYPILKIGDFGTATIFQKDVPLNTLVGSGYYIAPEVLERKYNEKCDIWSLGVIMYILLSGRPPFGGSNFNEITYNIQKGDYDLTMDPFNRISKEAIKLIKSLLCKDPSKRITAEQALQSDWFKNNKSKQLYQNVSNKSVIKSFIKNIKEYKRTSVLQETALAYLVHNFSQREDVEDAFKLFSQMDTSGDGKIHKAEFVNGLKKYVNEKEVNLYEIFANIDSDNSGFIQYEEFVRAALPKETFLDDSFLRFAFNYFDSDNSGTIDFKEIKEIFINSINKGQDAEKALMEIIKEVDSNSDGKVSFKEFCDVMVKMVGN